MSVFGSKVGNISNLGSFNNRRWKFCTSKVCIFRLKTPSNRSEFDLDKYSLEWNLSSAIHTHILNDNGSQNRSILQHRKLLWIQFRRGLTALKLSIGKFGTNGKTDNAANFEKPPTSFATPLGAIFVPDLKENKTSLKPVSWLRHCG